MKALLTSLLFFALSSCSASTEPFPIDGDTNPALLAGKPWRLVQFAGADGDAILARATLTVQFTGAQYGGLAGPNHYGGAYTATGGGDIVLEHPTSTLIGGPGAEEGARYLLRMALAKRRAQ